MAAVPEISDTFPDVGGLSNNFTRFSAVWTDGNFSSGSEIKKEDNALASSFPRTLHPYSRHY